MSNTEFDLILMFYFAVVSKIQDWRSKAEEAAKELQEKIGGIRKK